MANIQEITTSLNDVLDNLKRALNDVGVSSKELDNAAEWSKQAVDFLSTVAATRLTWLGYIVATQFDGEYIISPFDLKNDFLPYNYFCDVLENPDGSIEVSAYREAHNES